MSRKNSPAEPSSPPRTPAGERIRPEWVEAAAEAISQEVLEGAWPDLGTGTRAAFRRRADAALAAVIPAIQAQALRDWAAQVRENYPEDIFIPPTRDRLREVHEFCVSTGGTLDAISAALMRRAALLAEIDAKAIERGELP